MDEASGHVLLLVLLLIGSMSLLTAGLLTMRPRRIHGRVISIPIDACVAAETGNAFACSDVVIGYAQNGTGTVQKMGPMEVRFPKILVLGDPVPLFVGGAREPSLVAELDPTSVLISGMGLVSIVVCLLCLAEPCRGDINGEH